MTTIFVDRESQSTKAQLATLTQQDGDDKQIVAGSDHPLITIDINHQRLHEGRGFYSHVFKDANNKLADNASIDMVFAAAPGVSPHLSYTAECGAAAEIYLYEGTVTSGGTTYTPVCRRRVNPQTSDVAMVVDPTVSSVGTVLSATFLDGGAASGSSKNAGGHIESLEWVLNPLTNYMVRLTNKSGSSEVAHLSLYWYE
jgi:hypothetical protein